MDEYYLSEKFSRENFEEKTHRKRPVAEQAVNRMMAPPRELIWTILFTQKQLWSKFLMEEVGNCWGKKRIEMRPLAE